jgi:hypothetical protein
VKTRWALLGIGLLLGAAVLLPGLRAAEKKEGKSVLPGKGPWDLRTFNVFFDVVDTQYDEKAGQVKWVLETKDAYRTADFVREIDRTRPFVFVFLDEDRAELATVRLGASDFKGIPQDKVMRKGTALEVSLDVPNVIAKTKSVILRRGAGQ